MYPCTLNSSPPTEWNSEYPRATGGNISDKQRFQCAAICCYTAAYTVSEHCRTSAAFLWKPSWPTTLLCTRISLSTPGICTGSCQNGICKPSHTTISNSFHPTVLWWKPFVHTSASKCNLCCTNMHELVIAFAILTCC